MKHAITLLFVFVLSTFSKAQILEWTPVFATIDDTITITYDATQGNAGLVGASEVYAHTRVLTENSSGPSDWKYGIAGWNTNLPTAKMTWIGNDKWQLRYHIKSYYRVPDHEKVTHLAFVFRNSDGSRTGTTADGGDILLELEDEGLAMCRLLPESYHNIVEPGDQLHVVAISNGDKIELYIDDQFIKSETSDTLKHVIEPSTFEKQRVRIETSNASTTTVDSFYYVLRPDAPVADVPAETRDGITYHSNGDITLTLHAPHKEYVYLVGDWNNWEADPEFYLTKTPDDERYWLTLKKDQMDSPARYQYWVDGRIKIADPYTELILDPFHDQYISESTYPNMPAYPADKTTNIVSVLSPRDTFEWQSEHYIKPAKENLIIYELLLRDFLRRHDFETLIDTLGYFETLGVNAIELMPFSEFEGNLSWGYNPSFYFAPDKYYGPRENVKRFIDEAHKRGIAVIQDIVLNHTYGQSPMVRLYADDLSASPWYNEKSPNPVFSWGYDFNHESRATQDFVDRVTEFWLTEYKVDGFRFDFTKGFTNTPGDGGARDNARIALLKRMADAMWTVDPTAFIILEHFADNSEEKELAEYGMLIWGNSNYNYNEATMGYHEDGKSDFSWGMYKNRGWSVPNLVTYMESHDEERLMVKNKKYGASYGSYDVQEPATALSRMETAAALFFPIPGPKMIWQFGELGYDYPIDHNGRTGEKPIRWDYLYQPNRIKLHKIFSELIHLKKTYPVFSTTQFTTSFGSAVKWLKLNHADMNVLVVGNFDLRERTVTLSFQHTGEWYDYFEQRSFTLDAVKHTVSLAPGEYHIYMTEKIPTRAKELGSTQPESITLYQNYPNPFNPTTTIGFGLPTDSQITIDIFNLQGQKIKTLYDGMQTSGKHLMVWDSRDDNGLLVASGVYLYKLTTQNEEKTAKMLLIR